MDPYDMDRVLDFISTLQDNTIKVCAAIVRQNKASDSTPLSLLLNKFVDDVAVEVEKLLEENKKSTK